LFVGTFFAVALAALGFGIFDQHKPEIPDPTQQTKDNKVVVRVEWNTLNHNYSSPKFQPWLNWQMGDGGDSGSKPIVVKGADSREWQVSKGRHILVWISVDSLRTSRDAVHTLKLYVNGEQRCGPGHDDYGTGQGGHNAICETIS